MHGFTPYFVRSISCKSDNYLPGDARNLCEEIAKDMIRQNPDKADNEFLELYRQRYYGNKAVQGSAILHSCLLYILKMPFDFSSSIKQGLIL